MTWSPLSESLCRSDRAGEGIRHAQGARSRADCSRQARCLPRRQPTAILIRQVFGAVSQFEKAMVVSKLKGARERKHRATGLKVEGRKSYARKDPVVVAVAKNLHLYPVDGRRWSLRDVAAELAAADYVVREGKPYQAAVIKRTIEA